ncbi:hypothetical protein ACET3X_001345 [Alternaria dauci]|uniref:Glycoside hydrolase family 12 protein n=1 Tax=Alternaria dauci TaxID=48095 RepID=A0ABR3UX20_9PLEO
MKLSALLIASTASLALAVPTATIEKRADYCGQWDSTVTGDYTVYNNLWGQAQASAGGWQCTGVDGLSGRSLKWHTSWAWAGGPGHVKSYANVVTKITQKALSSVKSLPSVWKWSYTGNNLIANVAYDIFTSSKANGSPEYEIMIWVGALGGAGPISSTGSPIATVTLAGNTWKLYNGQHSQMNVFSFVADRQVQSFNGDLMVFVKLLTSKYGLPASQILTSVGAGTEPFSGSNARFTVTEYSLSQS